MVWIQGLSHNYLVNGVLNFSIWNCPGARQGSAFQHVSAKKKKEIGWLKSSRVFLVWFVLFFGWSSWFFLSPSFFTRYGRIEIDALLNLRFARSQRWRIRAITRLCEIWKAITQRHFSWLAGKFGYPSSLKEKARSFLFWTIIGDRRLRSWSHSLCRSSIYLGVSDSFRRQSNCQSNQIFR